MLRVDGVVVKGPSETTLVADDAKLIFTTFVRAQKIVLNLTVWWKMAAVTPCGKS